MSFVSTSSFWVPPFGDATFNILMFLLCLCCWMRLSTIFQVFFWTCVWGLPLLVFQSHKTFHVEGSTRAQHTHGRSHGLILFIIFNNAIKVAPLVSSKNHVFVTKKWRNSIRMPKLYWSILVPGQQCITYCYTQLQ